MSEGLVEKLKYFMGMGEEEYDEDYDYEEELEPVMEQPKAKKVSNNVVSLHTTASMKIVVHEPLKYEDAPIILNDLKMRKTIVVNLEKLEGREKRQVFDFISGGLYSLEGNIQEVTNNIFVLAPSSVEIDGLKDELKSKGLFSW